MRTLGALGIFFVLAGASAAQEASAQDQHAGMEMTAQTLLLATLDASQVVKKSESRASGTATFLIDTLKRTITYQLSYEGLDARGARSITVHNFAAGQDGEVIAVICDPRTPCPTTTSASLSGRLAPASTERPFDADLIGEFLSERVYVEIVDARGNPAIRGQLAPNGAMAPQASFVATMAGLERKAPRASGTAMGSETYMADGKVVVLYAATVAGLSSPPVGAALAAGPSPKDERIPLPNLKIRYAPEEGGGGSLSAEYETDGNAANAPLISRLRKAGHDGAGLVVMTKKFPEGEVYGVLKPLR
jgi:hypothetical protein